MMPDDSDEFVFYSIRVANEVLRQAVHDEITERPDLAAGLRYAVRLQSLSDDEIFDEAAALAPGLRSGMPDAPAMGSSTARASHGREPDEDGKRDLDRMHAAGLFAEPLLREYARVHGPLPAVMLDGTVRFLASRL